MFMHVSLLCMYVCIFTIGLTFTSNSTESSTKANPGPEILAHIAPFLTAIIYTYSNIHMQLCINIIALKFYEMSKELQNNSFS